MVTLGISCFYHDSAAALLVDGRVVAAAAEERFSRVKHDKSFPILAISYCMREAGIDYTAINHVVFYEKPFIKFERILRTHIQHFPRGFRTFAQAMPIWLRERLDMRHTISRELKRVFEAKREWDIRFTDHHISHATLAYFTSSYEEAAILVVDAVGEQATTSIMHGKHGKITPLRYQSFPHSIGLLYSAVTYYLGFDVNSDEYKVMGLAPYGKISQEIKEKLHLLVDISEDGSIIMNEEYFTFMYGLRMVDDKKWERFFGFPRRSHGEPITDNHKALAAAVQEMTEDILLRLAKQAKELTGCDRLCIAGGCALNCVAMGRIRQSGLFEDVFVPFAPGDDGGAIGAALYIDEAMTEQENRQELPSMYLGPSYSDQDIEHVLQVRGLCFEHLGDDRLYKTVAQVLADGKIVGWYQGRMEFGPRALGNRSILADPRRKEMKDIVNARVKFREAFRPFAPIVMEEYAADYFEYSNSPYMMFTTNVLKVNIPAVTHVDGTARIQTVKRSDNAHIHSLLEAFRQKTGVPVLLNTSFNVMGEPIVCSPEDAIHTFLNSGIDLLVINNYIVRYDNQRNRSIYHQPEEMVAGSTNLSSSARITSRDIRGLRSGSIHLFTLLAKYLSAFFAPVSKAVVLIALLIPYIVLGFYHLFFSKDKQRWHMSQASNIEKTKYQW